MEGKSYEGSRVMARRAALVGLVALVTAGFGGCGDSAEPSGPTVTQRITRDFGHELLASEQSAPLAGHGTVLRLLREYEEVKTSAGGSAVSSIDGLKADWERKSENDDESTWALIVNGIEADEEPGKYKLYPGDVIQWDLRYWYVTLDVRATVGAFPQTFTRGVFGKRFPVTVECARPSDTSCARVKGALRDAGVAIDGSPPAGGLPPRGHAPRGGRAGATTARATAATSRVSHRMPASCDYSPGTPTGCGPRVPGQGLSPRSAPLKRTCCGW